MGNLPKIDKNINLLQPKLSAGWVIGAILVVVVLLAVYGVAKFAYGKISDAAAPLTGKAKDILTGPGGW